LNIGPRPDGVIPIEQESRLREIALWNFINGQSVYSVEPWIVPVEDNIWLTKKRGEDTVYAIVTRPDWKWGARREFTLQSVRAGEKTQVSVLGQTSKVLEYQPGADVAVRFKQDERGLHVSAVRAQRIYNDRKWPGPVVLKVTDAQPALEPPVVTTKGAKAGGGEVTFSGQLVSLGKAAAVRVGFQYRLAHDNTQPLATADPWHNTAAVEQSSPGKFSVKQTGMKPGRYDFRAVVVHPQITLYGDRRAVTVR